jgi:GNAT superfamily N-acetyltransferase
MHQWVQERFSISSLIRQTKRRNKRQAAADEDEDEEVEVIVADGDEDDFVLSDEPDVEEDGVITFEPVEDEVDADAEPVEEQEAAEEDDLVEPVEEEVIDLLEEDEYWVDPPSQGRGIAAAWNAMAHPPVLRADFWRYLVLAVEGGYYADVDVTCLKPMDEWGLDGSMDGEA